MPRRFPQRFDPAIGLVALLLAINLLAILGLVSSRRDVRSALREQRALDTRAAARTFEALLAQQHADVTFLARTPPLSTLPTKADDPMSRRWARLDIEASLLLFLESSPAVERLEVAWNALGPHAVAERSGGAAQLAPPSDAPPDNPSLVSAEWSLGNGAGLLRAWIDPTSLLTTVGPGLRLHQLAPDVAQDRLEPVQSSLFTPRFGGWVERGEADGGVASTVEKLADHYGWTLFFNILLIPLSLVLVGLTLRRAVRLARLESEAAQQARLRVLESQVRHAERLASLGRFGAGIAHEINNPLEGMANYLHLLDDDLRSGAIDDARRWVPRLREGIDRAAGAVRQVLRFAEPGHGEKTAMDLARVVERTVEFLRGHPDCRNVEIRLRTPSTLPMEGDAQTLGQLVLNLVLNACQAQPEGGEIEVLASGADPIELVVQDRGPGFPAAVMENLFEPFQSTRGSLGLGLAVCRGIVVDHGGEISVAPRVDGAGSRVRVTLPAHPPEVEK